MNYGICLTNQESIIHWIDEFTRELGEFRSLIAEGWQDLEKTFTSVQEMRMKWMEERESL